MIKLTGKNGVYLINGKTVVECPEDSSTDGLQQQLASSGEPHMSIADLDKEKARTNTIAYQILQAHNSSADKQTLKLKVDALASHDITYVGIIQTARASGLKEFPIPYVLTNCHNTLCAVGGTINEDDHVFGLSAARKFGGIFVPAHQAVIHQYMREMMAGCGKIILASDSHTRYGALGTMGFGEGGPELVKQLLGHTYDMPYPEIVAVYLEGTPKQGVGPQDVALALIKAVFHNGFVKNRVLEFVGPGIANLSVDFRNGIDVMTTETTCLSSIWLTDESVEKYFKTHYRLDDFKRLQPGTVSYYDRLVKIDLSRIEPMVALPFHPSNAFTIKEANENAGDLLHQVEEEGEKLLGRSDIELNVHNKVKNGRILVDQGIVAGCAGGTFENIFAVRNIMENHSIGNTEFALSIYPASQPIFREMLNWNIATRLIDTGVTIRTAFCGPCFGAGDIPANRMLSVRHTTRNFPNREGSKPAEGQIASVALMDARSIAATAINKGTLTSAAELDIPVRSVAYYFDKTVYEKRIFNGFGKPRSEEELKFGPNIVDWPQMIPLPDNLLLQVCSVIHDPVTTTDELIPSGETSSYRSNPLKLASFTLSRKDPDYVPRAKAIQHLEQDRQQFVKKNPLGGSLSAELASIFQNHLEKHQFFGGSLESVVNSTALGSVIVAVKPGDGSAREQAASCQKVLGGWANVAVEYATKRYRSNVINWGMLPFIANEQDLKRFKTGDFLYVPDIKNSLTSGKEVIEVYILNTIKKETLQLRLPGLTSAERDIITAGCLMNYYKLFDKNKEEKNGTSNSSANLE